LAWTRGRRFSIYLLEGRSAWLLKLCDSQTSLICLIAAGTVILAGQLPFLRDRPGRLVAVLAGSCLSSLVLDAAFDIQNQVLNLLGRDPTLTHRTDLWRLFLSIDTNPVIGVGFMSFWSGERMEQVWSAAGASLNQAHSGYIEQYLNLGYVGVAFILLLLLSALLRLRSQLNTDASLAILRLCFLVAAILYNYTEASFYGINNMWILTLMAMIWVPDPLSFRHRSPPATLSEGDRLRGPGPIELANLRPPIR